MTYLWFGSDNRCSSCVPIRHNDGQEVEADEQPDARETTTPQPPLTPVDGTPIPPGESDIRD